ncbi:NUDIX domain-containing protein [Kytococcus sedentarius]|uniref:NUDIX domain-containing protein n=1 Tax=Kytococcus sedentarius TaxID=1276 RepID=UPI0035BC1060
MSRLGLGAERVDPSSTPVADEPTDHGAGEVQVLREGARYPLVGADVQLEDGVAWREWTQHPGAVAVVATRPASGTSGDAADVEVFCVRQYRHPVRATAWEVPAGLLDQDGEPMVDAAARELAEEAALVADTWSVLADYHTTPGGSAEAIRVFWASDVRDVDSDDFAREGEEAQMTGHWVRLSDLLDAVHAGAVHNPSTVIGALALDRVLHRGGQVRDADAEFVLGPVHHR